MKLYARKLNSDLLDTPAIRRRVDWARLSCVGMVSRKKNGSFDIGAKLFSGGITQVTNTQDFIV